MKHRRRVYTIVVAVIAVAIGAVARVQADDLQEQRVPDRAELAGIPERVKQQNAQTAKLARRNRVLTRTIATTTRRIQGMTRERSAVWVAVQKAAVTHVQATAYANAYREAFPIEVSEDGTWYIVRSKGQAGRDTTSWTIDDQHEYLVSNTEVTEYERGSAPNPYLTVPDYEVPDYGGSSSNGDSSGGCPSGSYKNVDGDCIPGPSDDPTLPVPGGPTATCADGTYSYSQNRSGTCSHHGGVGSWLP
jgi:cell division protein FtsB